MKLPDQRIEAAASKDELSRYSTHAVNLDVEHKTLEATDGHIAARIPVEVEPGDTSGLLPLDAIAAMRKAEKHFPKISVNSHITVTANGSEQRFVKRDGQFPNMDVVVPKMENLPETPTIVLDPDLILRLADALCGKAGKDNKRYLAFYVEAADKAVYVRGGFHSYNNCNPGFGIIMPVRPKRITREDVAIVAASETEQPK